MDPTNTIPSEFFAMSSNLSAYADWQIENKKAEFMEWLYNVYERDTAPLGLRGTYTGLWQQFQQDLANMYRDGVMLGALERNTSISSMLTK